MPAWIELDADQGLAERVRAQGIRWLRLREAEDPDLEELRGLELEGLSLRGCEQVRGTGLAALAGMPLRHLDLSGTSLVHSELRHLAELPLRHLDLSRTPLLSLPLLRERLEARPEDMAARMVLSEVWTERYTFRWEEGYGDFWVEDEEPPELDEDPEAPIPALSAEDLVEAELEDPERWRALRSAVELYELDLAALHGPMEGFAALPRSLRVLELAETPFGDREAGVLRELVELRLLGLAGTALGELDPLGGLQRLAALDLSGLNLNDLGGLAGLEQLRGLRLGGLRVDAELGASIASLRSLESLALHDATLLGGALAPLSELPMLRQLSLYRCRLKGAGLGSLGASSLRELDLTRSALGTDRLELDQLGALRMLRLSKTDLELEDLKRLRSLGGLEVLGLGFLELPRPALEALAAELADVRVELAFEE